MPNRRYVRTVGDLIKEIINQGYQLDDPICVTTDSEQDPGWTDFVVGAVDNDGGDGIELQCVKRTEVE